MTEDRSRSTTLKFDDAAVLIACGSGGLGSPVCAAFAAAGLPVHCSYHRNEAKAAALITSAVERVPVKDIMSAAPKAAIEMVIRGVVKAPGRFGIPCQLRRPLLDQRRPGQERHRGKADRGPARGGAQAGHSHAALGAPGDIANAALFLCSQQANYITGQSLAVDGGLQL